MELPEELRALYQQREQRIRERSEHADATVGEPYLLFRAHEQRCAIPVAAVESLMSLPAIRPVSQMPEAYLGLFDLRGRFHESFCLETLLGASQAKGEHLLLLRMGTEQLGLRVSEVEGLQELDPTLWSPLCGEQWPQWLTHSAAGPCYLLSPERLWENLSTL